MRRRQPFFIYFLNFLVFLFFDFFGFFFYLLNMLILKLLFYPNFNFVKISQNPHSWSTNDMYCPLWEGIYSLTLHG